MDTNSKFFWSDTYLILVEEEFDNIFEDLYEEKLINFIFEKHEAIIERKEFINEMNKDNDKKAHANFIFDPDRIRDLFK